MESVVFSFLRIVKYTWAIRINIKNIKKETNKIPNARFYKRTDIIDRRREHRGIGV